MFSISFGALGRQMGRFSPSISVVPGERRGSQRSADGRRKMETVKGGVRWNEEVTRPKELGSDQKGNQDKEGRLQMKAECRTEQRNKRKKLPLKTELAD